MKLFGTPARHTAAPHENTTDLLLDRHRAHPDIPLVELRGSSPTDWTAVSSEEFLDQVRALAKGLIASGLRSGDVLAIMSRTRYEWALVDWAVWFAGGISVPIYETSSPSQMAWIASDSGARFAVVETRRHAEDLASVKDETPALETIWEIDGGDLDTLREAGRDIDDETLERARTSRRLEDVATIIYTSGTTGRPKGAELTHSNFVRTIRSAGEELVPRVIPPGSRGLMFLPLAHVFARMITVLTFSAGVTTAFTPDTKNLVEDLQSFHPTFLLAVPRVFEKVYNAAEQKAEAGGKGKIFARAAETAIRYSEALDDDRIPLALRLQHALFDRLVYAKLRATMGGQVTWAVSGGAPLGSRLAHFFRGVGVTILEGYGLTETTAPVCVNIPGKVKIGTVGPPLPGVTVAIDETGEILVKGVNVFSGYHGNPEATAEALRDGWFRTGDVGSLDDDGYLRITGRSKELIVTAGGKNVSPAQLEDQLRAHPLVGQCMVVGDQRPFVAAIVTLDPEMLPTWLSNRGLPAMDVAQAAHDEKVIAAVQEAVDAANTSVSRAESIRKFVIIEDDFTEENGYLTPSMKLKRNVVVKDYADVIEEIYSTSPAQR
ncbi:AMP-binding protein [Brachybacterium sp. EF45031]|uniref:AMP-dependent synthetase/ligase n=1 Tax=Brachybacterium sillae TaxID=2810536 RepID=UPI00217E26C9|nr:long-chain fatty acid--CoA ligase [Brachybacterium sillae]MCS6710488.1 AMP-binding protein [Brachybacterium sillae]